MMTDTCHFHGHDEGPSPRPGWALVIATLVSLLLHWPVVQLLTDLISPYQAPAQRPAVVVQLEPAPVVDRTAPSTPEASQPTVSASPATPLEPRPRLAPVDSPTPAARPTEPLMERPPARKSVLQMVDEHLAAQPLAPGMPPPPIASPQPENVFHPRLRQALTQGVETGDFASALVLNNSSLADASERVGVDGKCFRLDNLGGGGDRRAWYPVTCKGTESTSDAMARGLREALEQKR